MNRITHKYIVNLRLLCELEKYAQQENITVDDILTYYRRLKLFYRHGLSNLER